MDKFVISVLTLSALIVMTGITTLKLEKETDDMIGALQNIENIDENISNINLNPILVKQAPLKEQKKPLTIDRKTSQKIKQVNIRVKCQLNACENEKRNMKRNIILKKGDYHIASLRAKINNTKKFKKFKNKYKLQTDSENFINNDDDLKMEINRAEPIRVVSEKFRKSWKVKFDLKMV